MKFHIEPGSALDRLIDQWVEFTLAEIGAWQPRPPRELLDMQDQGQMMAFGARLFMRAMEPEMDPGAVDRTDQPHWYGGRKDG